MRMMNSIKAATYDLTMNESIVAEAIKLYFEDLPNQEIYKRLKLVVKQNEEKIEIDGAKLKEIIDEALWYGSRIIAKDADMDADFKRTLINRISCVSGEMVVGNASVGFTDFLIDCYKSTYENMEGL